ncbi:MAG: hypothetical protein M3Q56_09835 [Bacteroidota bacterium]|nr:hypothetical protein [Bacteroidota bacterium]
MKKLLTFLLLFPLFGYAHPGIAIVQDSKGTIYYSDLTQVWKIINGIKSIVIPNVHTHELYIDTEDNLYGEHLEYKGEASNKFEHYLWVLRPNGNLDTLINPRQAYMKFDYSLARDMEGNEYFIKQFLEQPDTNHIIKKLKSGKEIIIATGSFTAVNWLHPQKNGSLLYVVNNDVYKIDASGKVHVIAENIRNETQSFKNYGHDATVWGVWQDVAENIYVAVYSDQLVKKITTNGVVSDYYRSTDNWAPTHGLFDAKNQLWLLEFSDKNETRVILAHPSITTKEIKKSVAFLPLLLIGIGILGWLVYWIYKMKKRKHEETPSQNMGIT